MQPNLSYASDNGDDEADEFSKCVLVLAEKVGVLTRRRESRLRLGTYEPRDKKQTVFPTLQALSGVFGTDQSTTLRLDLVVKDCIWKVVGSCTYCSNQGMHSGCLKGDEENTDREGCRFQHGTP
uniref:Uncharacterized protein n=1 Tax=Tanacetum cinerariifolium TaxID=118510 RepID=A0A6L2KQJ8_TANCI|nr:hypothetical protein [Tanacetum cinerariifolium]